MSSITRPAAIAMLLAAASACSTQSVDVAPGTPSADLVLRATGSGSWSVDCAATTDRGRAAAGDISGRGGESFDVIALRDAIEASCSYEAGDKPLTLTLEDNGMTCPFGDFENGICRTSFEAGTSGTLDFSPQ